MLNQVFQKYNREAYTLESRRLLAHAFTAQKKATDVV